MLSVLTRNNNLKIVLLPEMTAHETDFPVLA